MSRLKRFQHLEGPRADRPADAPRPTEGRFSRMEPERAPGSAPPPPPPGAAAERIQRQVSEAPLALEGEAGGEQLFIRCMHCEGDNGRFAQDCVHCGQSLHTPEQRAFNQEFWRRRSAENARQQEEERRFHQGREQAGQQASAAAAEQKKAAALMAADAAFQSELQSQMESEQTPPGIRWLRSMDDGNKQLAAIGGMVGVALLSMFFLWRGRHGELGWPQFAGGGCLLVLLWMFTPPLWWRYRRRRRGWWGLFFEDDDYY